MPTVDLSAFGLKNVGRIVEQLVSHPAGAQLRIDLSKWTFVTPPVLALLTAYARSLAAPADGSSHVIVLPRVANVRQYLEAMGFTRVLQTGVAQLPSPDVQYLPMMPLTTEYDADIAASRLKQIVLSKMGGSEDPTSEIARTIGTTLAELIENFQRHAETSSVGLVCAQFYPEHEYQDSRQQHRFRPGAIEIAIADTGIGIERSLRAVPEHAARIDAGADPCELATQFGVTSKAGKHSGYGLWVTRRLAERNLGTFVLLSGSSNFNVMRGRPRSERLPASWPGTFVGMRLNLHRPVDINEVYAEIPLLE